MSHELRHSVVTTGRLDDDDHGSHDIRDGLLEVADAETARALVARHSVISWAGDEPELTAETGGSDAEDGDADSSESDEDAESECAADTCSRTVTDSEYCWQHQPDEDG